MIDMLSHVTGVFTSIKAVRYVRSGDWVDGKWVEVPGMPSPHDVNIQPASDREIDFLGYGADRINDVRRVYINDGDMEGVTDNSEWLFLEQRWKTVKCDNRFWNNYCKLIVVRIDDQGGSP